MQESFRPVSRPVSWNWNWQNDMQSLENTHSEAKLRSHSDCPIWNIAPFAVTGLCPIWKRISVILLLTRSKSKVYYRYFTRHWEANTHPYTGQKLCESLEGFPPFLPVSSSIHSSSHCTFLGLLLKRTRRSVCLKGIQPLAYICILQ